MAEIHSLILKSDSREIKEAARDLDKLSTSATTADNKTDKLGKTTQGTSVAMAGMKTVLGTVVAALGTVELAKYADTWTNINSQLTLATKSTLEFKIAHQELFQIAQESRQELEATVGLYSRMARATEDLGVSQQSVLSVTEIVNKSLVISGANAGEASSAITQLGQAMAGGVLRGEEFNAISENGSRIAQALADSLGVTRGELRKMAEQGQLTSKIVIDALLKQSSTIDKEFNKMGITIDQSITVANNSLLRLIGRMDEASGVSRSTAETIVGLSDFIGEHTDDIAEFAADTVRVFKVVGIGLAQLVAYHMLSWAKLEHAALSTTEDFLNHIMAAITNAQNQLADSFLGKALGAEKTVFSKISLGAQTAKVEVESLQNSIMKMGIETNMLMSDIARDTMAGRSASSSSLSTTSSKAGTVAGAAGGAATDTKGAATDTKGAAALLSPTLTEYEEYLQNLKDKKAELLETLYPTEDLITQRETQEALISYLFSEGMITDQQRKDAMIMSEQRYQDSLTKIFQSGYNQREAFAAMSMENQTKTVLNEMIAMTDGVASENRAMFEINKAARLAEAVMELQAGVSKTFNAYPYPYNIGMAALHLASGISNIASIAKSSFTSKSASGSVAGGAKSAPKVETATPTTQVSQTAQAAPQATPIQVTISLGDDDMIISTASVRKLIEQINETAGDMGAQIRIA